MNKKATIVIKKKQTYNTRKKDIKNIKPTINSSHSTSILKKKNKLKFFQHKSNILFTITQPHKQTLKCILISKR